MKLAQILKLAVDKSASDIHIKAGLVPIIRKFGRLRPLGSNVKEITQSDIISIIQSITNQEQRLRLGQGEDVDLSFGLPRVGRFRVSIFGESQTVPTIREPLARFESNDQLNQSALEERSLRVVLRAISTTPPSLKDLNLPVDLTPLTELHNGLILVTGATGSGKSTTLSAILETINLTSNRHIITIEDPIEYVLHEKKCLITQREIGRDTPSFAKALRAALRQDPDVIMIGEMRDRLTMEIAMEAAETGHLVLSSLHTVDASETVNRILSAFGTDHHQQIRRQIASTLRAIISQRLCRRADKTGIIPVLEFVDNSSRLQQTIEQPEKTAPLRQVIQESLQGAGRPSFDERLVELVKKKIITEAEALKNSAKPHDMRLLLGGVSHQSEDSEKNFEKPVPIQPDKSTSFTLDFEHRERQVLGKKAAKKS